MKGIQAGEESGAPGTRAGDPYYDGEKLYAVGGGRYVQYNGQDPMPEEISGYVQRTGRKPPFMLLPEKPVDFHLSKGFGGAQSKIHWPGSGPLPPPVLNYLNVHGSLPRIREVGADSETDEADDE